MIALLNRYYRILLTVVVPTAATMSAVCLLIRMFSKSDKAVQEANAMLKRILIAAVIILAIGSIITVVLRLVYSFFDMNGYVPVLR